VVISLIVKRKDDEAYQETDTGFDCIPPTEDDCDRWDFCGRQWDDWERLFEKDPDEAKRQLAEYLGTQ